MKSKPVKGYEEFYTVNERGDVYSHRFGKVHRLKQIVGMLGYCQVSLYRDAVAHTCKVHHLVLEAFGFHREDGQVCRHLNGDPADNRIGNLRWGTMKENTEDMIRHGRASGGHPSRFTESELVEIAKTEGSSRDVAARFGVSKSYVCDLRRAVS